MEPKQIIDIIRMYEQVTVPSFFQQNAIAILQTALWTVLFFVFKFFFTELKGDIKEIKLKLDSGDKDMKGNTNSITDHEARIKNIECELFENKDRRTK